MFYINLVNSEKWSSKVSENYDPTLPEPVTGRKAMDSWFTDLFRMFPDYHVEKERIFAQDDWVCLEMMESGTLKGAITGPGGQAVPPTNKAFRMRTCIVCRVQHGRIREVRAYYDVLNLMAQLGLQP